LKYDVTIIGAGIVGLATGFKLKERNPDIRLLILDKEQEVAYHQTGHNSGVIHSGLYYKPGSMKARNCIHGYNLLLDFCRNEGIPFEICGKVVVATNEKEVPLLNNLWKRGRENGLEHIKKINTQQLKEYEPYVAGLSGLFVPQTGIIDYREVAKRFAQKIQEMDGSILLGKKVRKFKSNGTSIKILTKEEHFETKLLVNCAGLYADKFAARSQRNLNIRIIPFRGEYYEIKKEKQYLVKNLIYPVPDPNFPFLGVHFTRMINGGVEAGPNAVFATKREGYKKSDFDVGEFLESVTWPGFLKVAYKYWKTGMAEYYRSISKTAFTTALQKLLPELKEEDLLPGGSGVRAQACDIHGRLIDDFLILEEEKFIHVLNAPSPAATSSLSIGETVVEKIAKRF